MTGGQGLGWPGIIRLGLVQTALGAVVVMTTSTLNRVMVVELALPAVLSGALVAWHHGIQILRPRWGYGSDMGGRRTPWILGGMVVLALGGVGAAASVVWLPAAPMLGLAGAILAFTAIGIGVGAAGTSLLALLASRVAEPRRAAAATTVWLMMILGFILTTAITGRLLDPYSAERLVTVTAGVSLLAVLLAALAVAGIERGELAGIERGMVAGIERGEIAGIERGEVAGIERGTAIAPRPPAERPDFRAVMRETWAEPRARRFTVFVFVSMLAYSAQDLILEPFAGTVFGLSVGETTKLASLQHGGVLAGMILVAVAGSLPRLGLASLPGWTIGGCIASAAAFLLLAAGGAIGPGFPLGTGCFALGAANGAFAAAAIASMMQLAGQGRASREGTRMGLWGAAQAVAFGLGNIVGTAACDLARWLLASDAAAYSSVFLAEAALFLLSAILAARVARGDAPHPMPFALRHGSTP